MKINISPHEALIIRDYMESDYYDVARLWLLTDLGNPVRGDTNEVIKRTIQLGGKFLVLESESEDQIKTIVGTLWMTNDGRRILLHHFGILPEFQGKGYSELLLKEALRYVKKSGLQVKLEVHSSNIRAINLYNKFGFKHLMGYEIYLIRDLSKL
jgi:ribosomal protein S18 acetylase RimI-like enzyme